ncbi:membrane-spanning 4-domains subfamily A member 4A-like isoform X2 [Dendropsophus ebraccatus]|uniref:membrane-spanning 4-domains subfamily A member 4A-like isoform X2 n=1 Tax=Dendropsophus ebraccatus TaxID=150705 RepID=UPI0038317030
MVFPYGGRNNGPPCCAIPVFPCPPPYRISDVPDESQTMDFYETFLRGKPKLMGVLQIAVGILQLGTGITTSILFPHNYSSSTGYNIWGPLCIKAAFAMSICNIFLSCVGIAVNSCDVKHYEDNSFNYGGNRGGKSTASFLIFTSVLQFLLTISVLVSGFQSMRCNETGTPQVYVIPCFAPSLPPPPYSAAPLIGTEDPPSYYNINERIF